MTGPRLTGNPARAQLLTDRLQAADAVSAAPRRRHRPRRPDVDWAAVRRVLAGTMHHSHLTRIELAVVLCELDTPEHSNLYADMILRAAPGFTAAMRSRLGIPRRSTPVVRNGWETDPADPQGAVA